MLAFIYCSIGPPLSCRCMCARTLVGDLVQTLQEVKSDKKVDVECNNSDFLYTRAGAFPVRGGSGVVLDFFFCHYPLRNDTRYAESDHPVVVFFPSGHHISFLLFVLVFITYDMKVHKYSLSAFTFFVCTGCSYKPAP